MKRRSGTRALSGKRTNFGLAQKKMAAIAAAKSDKVEGMNMKSGEV